MKKLNNKGFTLIELLAVVVILAVVMGIAMNSVLSSMNKARGGSLQDTAQVIANAFNQKYTEALVGGVPTDVYGDVIGSGKGYDFSSSKVYYIDTKLADTFNISTNNYILNTTPTGTNKQTAIASGSAVSSSFVSYNSSNGKFVVCMFANSSGSNYVDAYKAAANTVFSTFKLPSSEANFKSDKLGAAYMVACNDGARTWQ